MTATFWMCGDHLYRMDPKTGLCVCGAGRSIPTSVVLAVDPSWSTPESAVAVAAPSAAHGTTTGEPTERSIAASMYGKLASLAAPAPESGASTADLVRLADNALDLRGLSAQTRQDEDFARASVAHATLNRALAALTERATRAEAAGRRVLNVLEAMYGQTRKPVDPNEVFGAIAELREALAAAPTTETERR